MAAITKLYECPNCNSTVTFKHITTNYTVCNNCSCVIKRDANDSIIATKKSSFINTISPIFLGQKGVWNNKPFEVIGGVRMWMQETVFHYWTIVLSDGSVAWLSEGYGLYNICLQNKLNSPLNNGTLNTLKIGDRKNFDVKQSVILTKKYKVNKIEILGEVLLLNHNSFIEIFEFAGTSGLRLEFHQSELQPIASYLVHATSFIELQLSKQSTHTILKSPQEQKIISCTYCKTNNTIKAWPYVQSFGCLGCKTKYRIIQNGEVAIKGTNSLEEKFELALGTKGRIKGVEYEIIGYSQKEEINIYKSKWKEYVLWNIEEGFCFLSEYNGHWIIVTEKNDTPMLEKGNIGQFNYDGKIFDIYNRYRYKILQSKGCFPYDIYDDEELVVEEFICPPQMWILEKSDQEGITWYHGKHIEKQEIETAFNVKLKKPIGVGAIETRGRINLLSLKIFTGVVLAVALIVHLIIAATLQEKVVFEQNFYLNDSTKNINTVTEKFELTKDKSNLVFDLTAPIENSWLAVDIQLINIKTGEEYNISQGLEYYSGIEDGENWSEGDKTTKDYVSSLPKGSYYLKLQSSTDSLKPINDFNLTITNDVPMDKNIIIILLLLLVAPLGYYLYSSYVEYERWGNSDFSPYHNKY